jgi:rhodanese-related sulfurtransferase
MEIKNGVLIDLRTNDEIKNKGTIKGSQQIDFLAKDSEKVIEALDKNKTYYIFCASGGRSGQCAELMQKAGFKEVIDLEKGFDGWKNKGYDIHKPN